MIQKSNNVYASFILRGTDLRPLEVSHILGILPTRSFQRGDIRSGDKTWPHGFWELESSGKIESNDLILHIEWIFSQLDRVKEPIKELLRERKITAKISCFWILPGGHAGISFSPELMRKISTLDIELEMDIYGDEPQ